ncbi:substrate-binding periplasmic protein [Pseudodesulfovibrio indicus]|uniref:Amino acid ABC transporter substrate-binding protein (PAAT family) n=1 Tax=Pseudodesulfovibrio indicus TaxID=1716143 RepID=A0A126QKU5_9BACT|nr:transporter substrate-binding domain-containing protein [Pseudodesulfovibrio indicus]AMK10663.1 hypothetical protein AWY79_05820 [Pseudodesulfovibrio indicus]TDT91637.1 amino acid ABC transporter substrate-binding protein (PAAT family) [Pseudodesulfovibrio indicus]
MRSFRAGFFALILLLAVAPAWAAEPVVIFGNHATPPKSWMENGTPRGILVDILHEIEARTGISFDIRLMPWKRAYMLAQAGNGGLIGLSKTKERLTIFDYSGAMYYDEIRLVVLKGNEFPYKTVSDLKGKVVGVTRGASYGDDFDSAKGRVFTPSEDTGPLCRLRMLLVKRIQVALIGPGEASVRHTIENDTDLRKHRDEFSILPAPFNHDPNYIGFEKGMRMGDTLREIDKALADMWKDGTIQAIEARY